METILRLRTTRLQDAQAWVGGQIWEAPPYYKVLRTTRLQVAGVGEAAVDHLGEGVEGVADVECVERCRAVDALKLLAFYAHY